MLWHFTGPGRHGVDLLALAPCGNRVLAVEVKGTLRPGVWPRLSRGALAQMSAAWIDKTDNPGMAEWDFNSDDVYGAVVLVNLADRLYRVGVTSDFNVLRPVNARAQLADLAWIDERL
jgi:hypothetical protein